MGIPNFQALLQPYSTTLILPKQNNVSKSSLLAEPNFQAVTTASCPLPPPTTHIAIIDGPSLAYHALSIAQSHARSQLHQWRKCKQKPPTNASRLTRRALSTTSAAIPSYAAVAAAMLAWLDALRHHGVEIAAIVFDGALPVWKREIRLERMRKLVVKLGECRQGIEQDETNDDDDDDDDDDGEENHNIVHNNNEEALIQIRHLRYYCRRQKSKQTTDGENTSQNPTTEAEFSAQNLAFHKHHHHSRVAPPLFSSNVDFPAPIFLVPAMLNSLRTHMLYANITRMVPGEADPYCAGYAQQLASRTPNASIIVVSSDSDLLAYDFGKNGQVMLFRDMDLVHQAEDHAAAAGAADDGVVSHSRRTAIQSQVYSSHSIAHRFGLKTLLPLAYTVHIDRHRSLTTNLVEARKEEARSSPEYRSFCREYMPHDLDMAECGNSSGSSSGGGGGVTPITTFGCSPLQKVLQTLDTKVSEFVHQWLNRKELAQRDDALEVYLPSGHEDAQRASMWTRGRDIRQVAYSILNSSRSSSPRHVSTVVERHRKGNRIGETTVPLLLKGTELDEHVVRLCAFLQESIATITRAVNAPDWRGLGLLWLCEALVEDERPIPGHGVLMDIYRGKVMRTWDAVQLLAQFQAILDSWSMLKQCISVHLALMNNGDTTCVQGIEKLRRAIECPAFHGLENMFDPLLIQSVDENDMREVVDIIFKHLGIDARPVEESKKSKKSKKRKNKNKNKSGSKVSRTSTADTANMYSLLASMDD